MNPKTRLLSFEPWLYHVLNMSFGEFTSLPCALVFSFFKIITTAAAVVTGSKRHLERDEPSVGRDEVGTKAGPDLQDSGNTSRTRHTGTSRGSLLGLFLEWTGVGSPSRADRGAGAGSGCLRRSPLPPFSFPTLPN